MQNKDFGWCFIGSGGIARRVLADILPRTQGGYLASVYSKTYANAKRLAEEYGGAAYETAEEALSCPHVRAAYVCTTHPTHKEFSLMALRKGIPVLCEKPAAMNAGEVSDIIDEARRRRTYFMEGMWTRHNPVVRQVVEWVNERRIGKPCSVSVSFSFSQPYDPCSRLYAVEHGGGALLDVGVYAVAFVQSIFVQKPVKIQSLVNLAPNGVDSINAALFQYEGGEIARIFTGLMADEPQDAVISGENGHIYVPRFWAPTHAILRVKGEEEQTTPGGFEGEGFQFEFDAVRRDVLAGKIENDIVPHAFTLSVAELLDAMKEAW